MNYYLLYFGTFAMIFFSCTMIFFVVWSSKQFNMQRRYNEQRDKLYLQRIELVENLVKNEFKIIIEHLKKNKL